MTESVLPGPRHPNLWPALPRASSSPRVDPWYSGRMASALADAAYDGVSAVESSRSLGVYVFIKLHNGQEFEAHVIERTPGAMP